MKNLKYIPIIPMKLIYERLSIFFNGSKIVIQYIIILKNDYQDYA